MAILRLSASRPRLYIGAVAVLAMLVVGLGTSLKTAATAHAAPSCVAARHAAQSPEKSGAAQITGCVGAKYPYYHSWYITKDTPAYMQNLANIDAPWASQNCPSKYAQNVTILDFGRPQTVNGVYGVFNSNFGWIKDSAIGGGTSVESLTDAYALEWYNRSSNCPVLYLGIGTASDYECQGGSGTCNVNTAGVQWDSMVHAIQSDINTEGFLWQVIPEAADDIETEAYSNGGWDPESTVAQFLNGVATQENKYSNNAWLIDYGTADMANTNYSCGTWSPAQVYAAAWSIGWDVPLPEAYWPNYTYTCYSAVSGWATLHADYPVVTFWGAMAECQGNDPLPSGAGSTCSGGQYTPDTGLTALGTNYIEDSYAWETNIETCGLNNSWSC